MPKLRKGILWPAFVGLAACAGEPEVAVNEAEVVNLPDLVVATVSVPTSARPFDSFTVTNTICNEGDDYAPSSNALIVLSTDATITNTDTFLMTRPVNQLFPGECHTDNTLVPGVNPTMGGYFVGVLADEPSFVTESDESNNTAASSEIGIGNGPDFVVASIDHPPSADGFIDLSVSVCNQGTDPGQVDVSVYLSADQTIETYFTNPMTPDSLIGTNYSTLLNPGQCQSLAISGSTFAPTPGAYYLGAVVDEFSTTVELIESNNTTVSNEIGIGYGPDIIVTAIDAPPVTDGAFTADVTACNQGTDFVGSFDVNLYLSADQTIEGIFANPMSPDVNVGLANFSYIPAGACMTTTANLWASTTIHAPFLGAIADEWATIFELIETNNTFVGERIGVGYGPELRIAAIDGPPNADGTIDLNVQVCNDGQNVASNVDVQLYASQDTEIEGAYNNPYSDPPIGNGYFSWIDPGTCQTTLVNGWVPVQGPHYVGGIVDEAGSIVELNEFNDTFVGALTGFGYGADIVVSEISGPPSADGAFDVDVTVCNQGTAPSYNADVEIYLSQDQTITAGFMGPDLPIGAVTTGQLQPNQCQTVTAQVNSFGAQGPYYLGTIADPFNNIVELLESNNTTTGALMGLGYGPDLIATAIDAPPSADGAFNVDVRVCNQGTAPSSGGDVTIVLSEDTELQTFSQTPTPLDFMCGGAPLPTLNANACTNITVPCGSYGNLPLYVGAVVDDFNSVTELLEGNNHFVGPLMGMGPGPDIIVTAIQAPPSANGPFDVDVTACNQGTTPSGSFDVSVYLSADQVITSWFNNPSSPDWAFGNAYFNTLAPSQCATVTVNGSGPFPNEAWYVGAIADESQTQVELIETNNTFVGPQIGLGSGPDIVVTDVSGPPSADGQAQVSVTVCNQGTTPAAGIDVGIYLTEDEVLESALSNPSSPDWPLNGVFINQLDAGQCSTHSMTAFFPQGPSPQYLAAIADESGWLLELNDDNNVLIGDRIGVGFGTDFVVTAVSGPPSTTGSFLLEYTVCNQGTASGSSDFAFFASQDTEITTYFENPATPDQMLGSVFHSLNAGDCANGAFNANVVGNGPLYLGGVADESNAQLELREDNNEATFGRIGVGNDPDLIVEALTAPPSADGSFNVGFTVCNQGTSASPPTTVEIYANTQAEVVGVYANPWANPPIASAPVASLGIGQCTTGTAMAYTFGQGRHYIGAIVDESMAVNELIEDNNSLLGPEIGFGNGPDLVVNVVSGPAFALPNSSITVDVTVCNQGTAPSSGTDFTIYLPAGNTTGGDIVPPLAAGACHQVTTWVGTPNFEGPAQLVAEVDMYNSVVELIETNNSTPGSVVTLATVFCGNGTIDQVTEECDDGNFVDGDGCSATCFIEHHVWGDNTSGASYDGPFGWNYAMGYHFTPNRDGEIVQLGGYFHGAKTVRLFDRATGALLAETTVNGDAGAGQFAYANITPVAVTSGTDYTVAVYLAGSGGTYRRPQPYFPQTFGDVTIHGTTWAYTGSNPDVVPTNVYRYYMFGQADITYVPTVGP